MKRFGTKIRELRKAAGIGIVEAGKRIGITKSYISAIETGKSHPPAPALIHKIAKVYRHSVRDLLLLAYIDMAPPELQSFMATRLLGPTETLKVTTDKIQRAIQKAVKEAM